VVPLVGKLAGCCPNLRRLTLPPPVDREALLGGFTEYEQHQQHVAVTAARCVSHLAPLTQLTSLVFEAMLSGSAACCRAMASLPSLQHLQLRLLQDCGLQHLMHLTACTPLTCLDVSYEECSRPRTGDWDLALGQYLDLCVQQMGFRGNASLRLCRQRLKPC
jgi:hypothetical protein